MFVFAGLLIGVCVALALYLRRQRGGAPTRETLARSRNYSGQAFANAEPVPVANIGLKFFLEFLTTRRAPPVPLPIFPLRTADFSTPPARLQAVWMGHSFVILDIDGTRLLFDPVYGPASPLPISMQRFAAPPLAVDELPRLDAVVITHDHYDHLERCTVQRLAAQKLPIITTLGVGARLRGWGYPPKLVTELDWHESLRVGTLEITATPARHFSGRSLLELNPTLWASWVLDGPEHRVFFSGDGGYGRHFAEIGKTYGPFDLTLMESGAWNERWQHAHQKPEEAVQAHLDLRGGVMLPIHWAGYDLAFHTWDGPIRGTVKAAATHGVSLATPRMGEPWQPGSVTSAWWEQVQ